MEENQYSAQTGYVPQNASQPVYSQPGYVQPMVAQPAYMQPEMHAKFKKGMRKSYSGMGWKIAVFAVLNLVLQLAYSYLIPEFIGDWVKNKDWYTWCMMLIPMYLMAFPIFYLLTMTQKDKMVIPKKKIGVGRFILAVFMCAGICGVGMILGLIVEMLLALVIPVTPDADSANTLANMMVSSSPFWRILTVGIGAPIVEEMIFRKCLIDRTIKYGEWMAIFTSGLLFGLMHGNFMQFFFATGLGMLFAFIYVRTGKIWYTILLHMCVNLTTSVITVGIVQWMGMDQLLAISSMDPNSTEAQAASLMMLPKLLVFYGWIIILIAFAITGIVLLIVAFAKKKFYLTKPACYVGKGSFVAAWCNVGVILALLYMVANFVLNYVPV